MGKIKNIVEYIKVFFARNIYLKLLSFFIAVLVWFVVIWSIDPSVISAVKNIPVSLGASDSLAMSKLGLDIIDGNNLHATVYIKGNRNIVGVINSDDILVKASLDNIVEAGTYELELEASVKNQMYKNIEFTAIAPSIVKIKVDKVVTKEIPLEIVCSGVSVPEGYILEEAVASFDHVTITGPEKDVEKVDKGLVVCDINKEISKTMNITENIKLMSDTLIDINDQYINLDYEKVNVVLPVLKKKVVPLAVEFINQPKDFPIEELEYHIVPEKIEIAGQESEIDQKDSLNIGYIDIKNFEIDGQAEYKIDLPSGFMNISAIDTAKVVFDNKDFDTKTLSNIPVKVSYKSANYDIAVNSRKINNVEFVGKKDILENLVSGDVIAEVDINESDILVGQMTAALKIYVPNKGLVWAIGDYKTLITIKEK